MIKNEVAILDKIGETAWAVVDNAGWLFGHNHIIYFPSRASARAMLANATVDTRGLSVVKVRLVPA